MWGLIQFAIVTAAVMSNIRWPWIDGGMAAGVVGTGVAYVVTVIGTDIQLRARLRREARLSRLSGIGD